MKIRLTEYDGCFGFEMVAETAEDASLLCRFSINSTKEIVASGASAPRTAAVEAWLTIGKRKDAVSGIRKAA